jgi:hypothetical protein
MGGLLNCGNSGWLMIAASGLTYAVLALAGAALIKYIFFANREKMAA